MIETIAGIWALSVWIAFMIGYTIGHKRGFWSGVVTEAQVSLGNSYAKVRDLVVQNAIHKKRGVRICTVDESDMIKHAFEELTELNNARNDIEELADVFGILFHYMIHKGWTPQQLDAAIVKKLNERFET